MNSPDEWEAFIPSSHRQRPRTHAQQQQQHTRGGTTGVSGRSPPVAGTPDVVGLIRPFAHHPGSFPTAGPLHPPRAGYMVASGPAVAASAAAAPAPAVGASSSSSRSPFSPSFGPLSVSPPANGFFFPEPFHPGAAGTANGGGARASPFNYTAMMMGSGNASPTSAYLPAGESSLGSRQQQSTGHFQQYQQYQQYQQQPSLAPPPPMSSVPQRQQQRGLFFDSSASASAAAPPPPSSSSHDPSLPRSLFGGASSANTTATTRAVRDAFFAAPDGSVPHAPFFTNPSAGAAAAPTAGFPPSRNAPRFADYLQASAGAHGRFAPYAQGSPAAPPFFTPSGLHPSLAPVGATDQRRGMPAGNPLRGGTATAASGGSAGPMFDFAAIAAEDDGADTSARISDGMAHLSSARRRTALFGGSGAGRSAASGGFASYSAAAASSVATTATTATTDADGGACCVAAVVDNGAREVGVAMCLLPAMTIAVAQFGDTFTFSKVLALLHARSPVEVIVPKTSVAGELTQTMMAHYGREANFTAVRRRFFDAEGGVRRLSELRAADDAAAGGGAEAAGDGFGGAAATVLALEDTDRYLCVAAAHALLAYIEAMHDIQWVPGTLRVRCLSLADFAEVSRSTARALHITAPQPGQAAFTGTDLAGATHRTTTLIAALPPPSTAMGRRLLRSSLLQPLGTAAGIACRQDAVGWLCRDPGRVLAFKGAVGRLASLDVERLMASLSLEPRGFTAARARALMETLLHLWAALDALVVMEARLSAALPAQQQQQQQQQHEGAAGGSGGGSSSEEHPTLLYSIADTLRRCRLAELSAACGEYLDVAVRDATRPASSVVAPVTVAGGVGGNSINDINNSNNGRNGSFSVALGNQERQMRAAFEPAGLQGAAATAHYQQQQQQQQRASRGGAGGGNRQVAAKRDLLAVLCACFALRAAPESALDVLRSQFSAQVNAISEYHARLRAAHGIASLRLETDSEKLYVLSYAAAEDAKTAGGPFKNKYAGGSHYDLYIRSILEQQAQRAAAAAAGLAGGGGGGAEAWASAASSVRPARSGRTDERSEEMPQGARDEVSQAGAPQPLPAHLNPLPMQPSILGMGGGGVAAAAAGAATLREQRRQRQRRVRCTTPDLERLCSLARRTSEEMLLQSLEGVQPLLALLRGSTARLQAMAEAVALLDMLLSFACYTITNRCVRPVFTSPSRSMSSSEARESGVGGSASLSYSAGGSGTAAAAATASRSFFSTDDEGAGVAAAGAVAGGYEEACELIECRHPSLADPAARSGVAGANANSGGAGGLAGGAAGRRRLGTGNRRLAVPGGVTGSSSSSAAALAGGLSAPGAHVSNTVAWRAGQQVLILTGPNNSGKTTLLRQVGQLFALAQCGCFIPARAARLFVADRIVAHMLCDEPPAVTTSTFTRELLELSEVTHAATARSLVLVDELGRATTTTGGLALAWAAASHLARRRVHTLFTTHFADLTDMADCLPNVGNRHFGVVSQFQFQQQQQGGGSATRVNGGEGEDGARAARAPTTTTAVALCTHRLEEGPCTETTYGLSLAAQVGLHPPTLALAQVLWERSHARRQVLQQQQQQQQEEQEEQQENSEAGEAREDSSTQVEDGGAAPTREERNSGGSGGEDDEKMSSITAHTSQYSSADKSPCNAETPPAAAPHRTGATSPNPSGPAAPLSLHTNTNQETETFDDENENPRSQSHSPHNSVVNTQGVPATSEEPAKGAPDGTNVGVSPALSLSPRLVYVKAERRTLPPAASPQLIGDDSNDSSQGGAAC